MRHSLRHRRGRIRMHASACVARRGRSRALAAATPERPARHSRCNLSGSVATRHVRCDAVGCVWRVAGGTSSAASTPNPASKRRSSRRSTWRVRRACQSGNFRSVSALSINSQQTRRSGAPIGARLLQLRATRRDRARRSVRAAMRAAGRLPASSAPGTDPTAASGAKARRSAWSEASKWVIKASADILRSDRWPRPVLLLPSAARRKRRDDRAAHGLARRVQDGDCCRL